jgi:cell wall-associated NlpC family hydrolase
LHRFLTTGLALCVLTAGLPLVASAAETVELSAPAASATVVAGSDVAAPTDGADLAMWNASPAKAEGSTTSAPAAVPPARLAKMLHVQRFATGIAARGAAMASNLTHNALKFLGVPYAFGGTSAYGFDCSGYVQHVFAMMGMHLPRTADAQYDVAHRIVGAPQAGDLVFFHTYAAGVSHVGIALGNGRFVHASSSHGVTVSSLSDSYWGPRYLGAKRVVN